MWSFARDWKEYYQSFLFKHDYLCTSCRSAKGKEWSKKYPERARKMSLKAALKYYKGHRKECIERRKLLKKKIRDKVIKLYGGKCQNCGCSNPEVLELNHIKGGGTKEFKAGISSDIRYRRVLRGMEPKEKYNLLCKVCNQAHYCKLRFGEEWCIRWK